MQKGDEEGGEDCETLAMRGIAEELVVRDRRVLCLLGRSLATTPEAKVKMPALGAAGLLRGERSRVRSRR